MMPLRSKQNFELRLEMALEDSQVAGERENGEQAKFKESTAVFQPEYTTESKPTAISEEMLGQIVDGLTRVPEDFTFCRK